MRKILVLVTATVAIASSVAYAASLNVSSWHLWSGSQTLTKSSCTLSGTSSTTDTYVDQTSTGTSFGSNSTMFVGAGSGQQLWTFIRFNLSSCAIPATGGADSATLTLPVKSNPNSTRTVTVTPVLSNWSGTLTWNQAQSLSYGSATTTFQVTTATTTASATVTLDVDQLIRNGSANFGWRLRDNGASQDQIEFRSSENSPRPQLVINYEK